jgi:hypothetical protein
MRTHFMPESEVAEWRVIRQNAERILKEHAEMLETFRVRTAKVLGMVLKSKQSPFARRPNVSMRLICEDDPPAKLVSLPSWNSRAKTVNLDWLSCEFMQEQTATVGVGSGESLTGHKFDALFTVSLATGLDQRIQRMRKSAESDLRRLLNVVRDFVDDGFAVFARSHDHCCICGRALTDGKSCMRGIGPECIQTIDFGVFDTRGENRLILPDDEDADYDPSEW